MNLADDKDDAILLFLRELSAQGIDWQIKDHWQGDRAAISLTSAGLPNSPTPALTISTLRHPGTPYRLLATP
jgi:hypothetical protein